MTLALSSHNLFILLVFLDISNALSYLCDFVVRGRGVEVWIRERVDHDSLHVLSDVSVILVNQPSAQMHILEYEPSAYISLIASNDARWEETTLTDDISESDVSHIDSWLGLAVLVKWVDHAAWTATIWLLLLLGSNIDGPPDGIIDGKVLVKNVLNAARTVGAWVSLDVDGLQGEVLNYVSEGNVSYASIVIIRWYRSNGHTNTHVCNQVLSKDIFSTLCDLISLISWLHSDRVIITGNVHIPDNYIASRWINPISVQWESRNAQFQVELSVLHG